MPIPAPKMRWPTELHERGPDGDRRIMLVGHAEVAGKEFKVTALRVDKGRREPDFRDDIPASAYEVSMSGMLDDVEDLVDSMEPELVVIDGADYLLWMVPSAHP
jgi:hypothetical protein